MEALRHAAEQAGAGHGQIVAAMAEPGVSNESAAEMLSALLGDGKNMLPLKRLIVERTEGTLFFMEETVQVLIDAGALMRDGGAMRLTRPLNELKIPPTVQGILAARIDRLPDDALDVGYSGPDKSEEWQWLELRRSITEFALAFRESATFQSYGWKA